MQVIVEYISQNEEYIVGPHNREAYLLMEQIVKNPGRLVNPLFVYGGQGMGKTRLSKILVKQVKEKIKNYRIIFADMRKEESIKNMLNYKNTKKKINFLVIDGFDNVGQIRSKDEIFNLVGILRKRERQVIIVSDKPPSEIEGLDDQQRYILTSGKVVKIITPSYKERVYILECMSFIKRLELPEGASKIITHLINEDIRTIENVVMHVSKLFENGESIISKEDVLNMFETGCVPGTKSMYIKKWYKHNNKI